MRKVGFAVVLVILSALGLGFAQIIPNPPPEKDTPAHNKALADAQYPSAQVCAKCHPKQYDEWSISSHAYGAVSPMFNKFEQKINDLASGTINSFCVRCHSSVGTALGERRDIAWWDRSGAAKEGITCVSCHRVGEADGKVNGARRITPGNIHESVFGPFDTTGVLKAISDAQGLKILVTADEPDRKAPDGTDYIRIHQQAIPSTMITEAELCVPCHQVAVHAGIKLETVWEEYRNSPAHKEGITCQQCHMSPTPGRVAEFPRGPAAYINGQTVNNDRPLTNHEFYGPGYPVSHPGLFPWDQNSPFTPQQWLTFDYRKDWGSEGFENKVAASPGSYTFPAEWQNADKRKEAWKIVQGNLAKWREREKGRRELLENAAELKGPFFETRPEVGRTFKFNYTLKNLNKGHNLPSGSLGAQPELWIDVALIDPDGKVAWESGYVDSYGDVADVESLDVRDPKARSPFDPTKRFPFDEQLVNMQAKFITTNVKGTDREMYLPINLDFDQLPFIRPGGTPPTVVNHPPFVRMEKHSIPPLATRTAHYRVPADKMTKPGPYKLAIRLRGRTEPMYFMRFVEATEDMKRSENEWVTDTHLQAVEFDVGSGSSEPRKLDKNPVQEKWFLPDTTAYNGDYKAQEQLDIYGAKHMNDNPTGVPFVELGIRLYDRGAYTPRPTWLGSMDPIMFGFMTGGDLRLVGANYDNGNPAKSQSAIAARLNLDMDLQLTPTERFHAFTRPLDHSGQFTRYAFNSGGVEDKFVHKFDFNLDTLFFEGDVGNIAAGWRGHPSSFDLPFAVGRFPFATQNGVWIEDAFDGAAFTPITAKSFGGVSNTDLTFFTGLRKVTTAAIPKSDEKTRIFGLAGFADTLGGYVEYGYGYVDAVGQTDLSYHNATASFTRRYHGRLANSVRVIGNFGQKGTSTGKTADGVLLLVENEIIPRFTPRPNDFTILNFVPYVNLFAGFNSPQSLARGGDNGTVLRNTGINFESDGVTAYPTLDGTAKKSYGGAAGLEYLFDLHRQIVLEGAVVERMQNNTAGRQFALGARYQHVLTKDLILRMDAMRGWREKQKDIYGARIELRLKF